MDTILVLIILMCIYLLHSSFSTQKFRGFLRSSRHNIEINEGLVGNKNPNTGYGWYG